MRRGTNETEELRSQKPVASRWSLVAGEETVASCLSLVASEETVASCLSPVASEETVASCLSPVASEEVVTRDQRLVTSDPSSDQRPATSDRFISCILLLASCFLLLVIYAVTLAQSQSSLDARVNRIGKKLLCLCGCNQILVECNHLNCSFSETAKAKLRQAAMRYDNDDMVIQAMVQEYGTKILAAPPTQGFNLTAWIAPVAATAIGLLIIALTLRRWWARRAVPQPSASATVDQALRERTRRAIEEEIGGV